MKDQLSQSCTRMDITRDLCSLTYTVSILTEMSLSVAEGEGAPIRELTSPMFGILIRRRSIYGFTRSPMKSVVNNNNTNEPHQQSLTLLLRTRVSVLTLGTPSHSCIRTAKDCIIIKTCVSKWAIYFMHSDVLFSQLNTTFGTQLTIRVSLGNIENGFSPLSCV